MKDEVKNTIKEYREAYGVANAAAAPEVTYERGWYRIGNPSTPVRGKQIKEFTERLWKRAAEAGRT